MVLTALQMRLFEETCENERRIAEHWSDRRPSLPAYYGHSIHASKSVTGIDSRTPGGA